MESQYYFSYMNGSAVNWTWKDHFANVLGTSLVVVFLSIMVLGIVGNSLVLYIICKHREMQTATNLYIANLAAADIIMLVVCAIPLVVTVNMIQLDKITCKILEYVTHVTVQATCLTLMAMTIDRYNIIVHAVRSRRTRTTRKALLVNVYIWAGSLVLQLPVFIMTDVVAYRCDIKFESLALRLIYHCYVTASTYVFPLLVVLCCYLGILFQVWQKSFRGTESAEAHLRSNYRKRRITRMVFIVVVLFALCWLPNNVFRMWRATDSNYGRIWIENWEIMNILSSFIIVLSYSNSLINPFVYAFITTAFRKCLHDSLCAKRPTYDSHVMISHEVKTVSTQRCAREAETV